MENSKCLKSLIQCVSKQYQRRDEKYDMTRVVLVKYACDLITDFSDQYKYNINLCLAATTPKNSY